MPRCGLDLSALPPLPSMEIYPEVFPSGNDRSLHCPGSKDPKGEEGETAAIPSPEKMAGNGLSCEMPAEMRFV